MCNYLEAFTYVCMCNEMISAFYKFLIYAGIFWLNKYFTVKRFGYDSSGEKNTKYAESTRL